jgi:hypothetical protein
MDTVGEFPSVADQSEFGQDRSPMGCESQVSDSPVEFANSIRPFNEPWR